MHATYFLSDIPLMPTYIYETIAEPHEQFEVRQSMKDDALTHHPQTGAPVRRVIMGGYGILQKSATAPCGQPRPKKAAHSCCGSACGCAH